MYKDYAQNMAELAADLERARSMDEDDHSKMNGPRIRQSLPEDYLKAIIKVGEESQRRRLKLDTIKVGDKVNRLLAGVASMELTVSEITATEIICGEWKFCRQTGAEIDEYLGWDEFGTGSYITCN